MWGFGDKNKRLLRAIKSKDRGKLGQLVKAGADPNACDAGGKTALILAVETGDDRILAELLQGGARPNVPGTQDRAPLHAAADIGNPAMVEKLLKAGADPSRRDRQGATALDLACRKYHKGVIQLLLTVEGSSTQDGPEVARALVKGASLGDLELISLALDVGVGRHVELKDKGAILIIASRCGHARAAAHLISGGDVDLGGSDKVGSQALAAAVEGRHGDILHALVQAGAARACGPRTLDVVVGQAVAAGDIETARLLVREATGAPESGQETGSTELRIALAGLETLAARAENLVKDAPGGSIDGQRAQFRYGTTAMRRDQMVGTPFNQVLERVKQLFPGDATITAIAPMPISGNKYETVEVVAGEVAACRKARESVGSLLQLLRRHLGEAAGRPPGSEAGI